MSQTAAALPPLQEYIDWRAFQSIYADIFPTEYSLLWFIRQHKQRLAEGNAIMLIAGQRRCHPRLFEQIAVEIGLGAERARQTRP